jgi:hypothetical protein
MLVLEVIWGSKANDVLDGLIHPLPTKYSPLPPLPKLNSNFES